MSNNKQKTRIVKSENILSELIALGEKFRVGLPYSEELIATTDLKKYGIDDTFVETKHQIPKAVSPKTKINLKGLYIRKQPEEKEEIKRHIKYVRKTDNTKIEYDRIYNVYKKELLDKLNLGITFMQDKDGNKFIVSDILTFDDDFANSKKNTHIINLFLDIFHDYEILRENLEYYIKSEVSFENEILPSGTLVDERNFGNLIEIAERYISDEDKKPLINRLNVFKEFAPIIRKGKGYNGYIALVFEDKGIVAAESIKRNNATYFFKLADYEDNIMKNKQEVITDKLMLKRCFHTDEWEKSVRKFLNKH